MLCQTAFLCYFQHGLMLNSAVEICLHDYTKFANPRSAAVLANLDAQKGPQRQTDIILLYIQTTVFTHRSDEQVREFYADSIMPHPSTFKYLGCVPVVPTDMVRDFFADSILTFMPIILPQNIRLTKVKCWVSTSMCPRPSESQCVPVVLKVNTFRRSNGHMVQSTLFILRLSSQHKGRTE